MSRSLQARLRALERAVGMGERVGLATVETLIAAWSRTDDEVTGITTEPGHHLTVRLPGESLDDLERRANPTGCWRAFPQPVFGGRDASNAQATAKP